MQTEKHRINETIQGLQLETDSNARALMGAIADKEKQLVDHDVLKLQVGMEHSWLITNC